MCPDIKVESRSWKPRWVLYYYWHGTSWKPAPRGPSVAWSCHIVIKGTGFICVLCNTGKMIWCVCLFSVINSYVMDKPGFKKKVRELIEHKMISTHWTWSPEESGKENNFYIRKRLLEHDDGWTTACIVYTQTSVHAFGWWVRIGMDIVDRIWDRCAYARISDILTMWRWKYMQDIVMEAKLSTEEEYNKMRQWKILSWEKPLKW